MLTINYDYKKVIRCVEIPKLSIGGIKDASVHELFRFLFPSKTIPMNRNSKMFFINKYIKESILYYE